MLTWVRRITNLTALFGALALVDWAGFLDFTAFSEVAWFQIFLTNVIVAGLLWIGWTQNEGGGSDVVARGLLVAGVSCLFWVILSLVLGLRVSGVAVPSMWQGVFGSMTLIVADLFPWYMIPLTVGVMAFAASFVNDLLGHHDLAGPMLGILFGLAWYVWPDPLEIPAGLLGANTISTMNQWGYEITGASGNGVMVLIMAFSVTTGLLVGPQILPMSASESERMF